MLKIHKSSHYFEANLNFMTGNLCNYSNFACKAKPGKTGLTGEPGESGPNWLNPMREALMNFVMAWYLIENAASTNFN